MYLDHSGRRIYFDPQPGQITEWPLATCPIPNTTLEGQLDLQIHFSSTQAGFYGSGDITPAGITGYGVVGARSGYCGGRRLIRSLVMLLTARLTSSPRPPSILTSACHPVVFLPAQCNVRVDRDHKDNPAAQCTAYYLDFFKCADACQAKALFAQLK